MSEKTTALAKSKSAVTELQLTPQKFAEAAVSSGMFKDTKSIAEAYMKMTLGASLGIDPATSMASIYLIQGRPSFSANLIAARIKQSGRYRFEVIEKSDDKCVLQFWEQIEDYTEAGVKIKKWVKPGPPETFTVKQAEKAQITGRNPNWKLWPSNMCFCRALTNGARTYCADIMVGAPIYTPDELDPGLNMKMTAEGDLVPDAEYTSAPTSAPLPGKERAVEIRKLMADTGTDEKTFLTALLQKDDAGKLTAGEQDKVLAILKSKRANQPATATS